MASLAMSQQHTQLVDLNNMSASSPVMCDVIGEGWLQALLPEVATRLLQIVSMKLKEWCKN